MPEDELTWSDENYIKKYGPAPKESGYVAVRWGGPSGGWFLAYACTVPLYIANALIAPEDPKIGKYESPDLDWQACDRSGGFLSTLQVGRRGLGSRYRGKGK